MQSAYKKIIFVVIQLLFIKVQAGTEIKDQQTTVSVLKFTDKTAVPKCDSYYYVWYKDKIGDSFADVLIEKLSKNGKYQVLEREVIKDIYQEEVNLINSEESETLVKTKKFEKAKYTFVGSVTEFEDCAESKNVVANISTIARFFGHDVPDIGFENKEFKTHIAVQLRMIETETGKIVKSVKGEARLIDKFVKLDTDFGSVGDNTVTPVGKTIDAAIEDAVKKILN